MTRSDQSGLENPVIWAMCVILLGIVFWLDWFTGPVLAVEMLYVLVIMLTWLFRNRVLTIVFGVFSSLLMAVDWYQSRLESPDIAVDINHSMCLVAVWSTVLLVSLAKSRATALLELNENLEGIVQERTREQQKQLEEIQTKSQLVRAAYEKIISALDEVTKARTRLSSILESAPDGVVILDEDGKIETANRALRNIFGLASENVIGSRMSAILPGVAWTSKNDDGLISSPVARIETEFQNEDKNIPLEVSLTTSDAAGERLITAFIRDISERKEAAENELRAEVAQARIRELEQFAYVASHDLQEPLRVVTNFLQLLELEHGEELSEGAKEYIETAITNTRRMRGLVNGLLEYSRVGNKALNHEILDVDELMQEVLQLLSDQVSRTGAQIKLAVKGCNVKADVVQMRQLFQNLISNALKFVEPDVTPEVEISGVTVQGRTRINVMDNGIGISEEHQDTVFKIFGRINPRQDFEGHGIGMSVAERIVANHRGKLTFTSAPGKGTTFHVDLPAAKTQLSK